MNPAVFYHPEAYTTSGPKLMGRNAAGESFLRGFLKYSKSKEFWLQVQRPEHAQHFVKTAMAMGRPEPVRVVTKTHLAGLERASVVYYPGPGIGENAWQRAVHGHGAWSLCGITHTTASAGAMDGIAQLLTTPVQPWDALICTSAAVKNNVELLLQAQSDFLQSRLACRQFVYPQLPVIPLGIHTSDFEFTAEQKASARLSMGIDADTVVVLFMGRLSFHAKAHPLAMYQALQRACIAADKKVVLVECGWHANEYIAGAYREAAQLACPSVDVLQMDGREAESRNRAWACADVFCSLSDNIQETFGIVPIEAMAAGLPVVVSDWDGYKDTVRHGKDGFRVPTCMPQAGLGSDLAYRHALEIDTYDMYCGNTCSMVAVDVEATALAFFELFNSEELRLRMGEAGRIRARQRFDWSVIIAQYENLWEELEVFRMTQAPNLQTLAHPWPARMDPFYAFAAYPTDILSPQTLLVLVDATPEDAMRRLRPLRALTMVEFANQMLPSDRELSLILEQGSATPRPASKWVAGIAAERQAFVFRALAWLLKMGVLKRVG